MTSHKEEGLQEGLTASVTDGAKADVAGVRTSAGAVGFTPGPWQMFDEGRGIWAPNAKAGGVTKIFDIRGWGYLTGLGHGALGLSEADAIAIQCANGRLAAAAPDLYEALNNLANYIYDKSTDLEVVPLLDRALVALQRARGEA